MKTGVLLINLGTPDSPSTKDVRKYLKEFLNDPRVVDLPVWVRRVLVYGAILPFRPKKTAHAYQSVWEPTGSPLMHHSLQLSAKLQAYLGDDYLVSIGMRYGRPSLASTIESLLPYVNRLVIVPLYPQYASSTTGSAVEKCFEILGQAWNIPPIEVLKPFYGQSWYLEPLASQTQKSIDEFKPDHILMSFHGLPVRHIEKSHCKPCTKPCPTVVENNPYCYRAQCYATARGVMQRLVGAPDFTVCFQSRLGRIPWIQPYTDEVLNQLLAQGHKRLSVACPSFVADCLETLEEIGLRLKEQWLDMGGQDLQLIPALNASDAWVQGLGERLLGQKTLLVKQKIA